MKKIFTLFLILGLFLSPLLLIGETTSSLPENYYKGDLALPEISFEGAQTLSLEEATKLAVAQNLEMDFIRLDWQQKKHEIPIAKSVYDTILGIEGTYEQDRQERSSIILGNKTVDGKVEASLEKKLPTGTTVKTSLNGERHSTTSTFSSSNRNYTGFLKFEVDQPLLKNFFGYIDRNEIKKVVLNTKKFNFETLDQLEDEIASVREQYWDLVFAYWNLLDRKKDLVKAQEFLKLTEDKMDLGLTEKPDEYAAEANVRNRIISLHESKNQLAEASYALKVLLNVPQVELIIPENVPEFQPVRLDFSREYEAAIRNRRDLKAMVLSLTEQRIETKIKWNERLPELDFTGSMAGTSLDRDLINGQGKIWDYDHPQYFAGVSFSFPVENREARHQYSQAKLEYVKRMKELENLRLRIGQEIDRSIRELDFASERVKQTRQISELQHKKLEEEERNFNLGRSESKTIIDFQEDVILAETEETLALVDFAKALESYYETADLLLEKSGLTEQEVLGEGNRSVKPSSAGTKGGLTG